MLFPRPTLKILVDQRTVYVHPPLEGVPSSDPVLDGRLVLTLPKASTKFSSLVVRLVAHYSLTVPNITPEAGTIMESEVRIDNISNDKVLAKGEHIFAFSFVIPSSSPPYERCQYGKVNYKLHATAKGAGLMGTDVEDELECWIITNPTDEDDTTDVNLSAEGYADELGPYSISMASHHLTVSGLAHFHLVLASSPSLIHIHSINAYITQSYQVTSVKTPTIISRPPAHRRELFTVDANLRPDVEVLPETAGTPDATEATALESRGRSFVQPDPHQTSVASSNSSSPAPSRVGSRSSSRIRRPPFSTGLTSGLQSKESSPSTSQTRFKDPRPLQVMPQGGSYEMCHLVRLPNDDLLRGSTLERTKTPLHITHDVTLEVRFTEQGKGIVHNPMKILRVIKPITITSCCCTLESLLVPPYSEVDTLAVTAPTDRRVPPRHEECLCGASWEKLISQRQRDLNLRFEEPVAPRGHKAEYVRVDCRG